jgi:hypothetical protein
MKIRIDKIADRGVPNMERLHLTVLEATDLSSHIVVSSAYATPQTVVNGGRACFWFPPETVKPTDEIVLFTRAGNYEPPKRGALITTYTYYWGLQTTIWNKLDTCALLFDVSSWSASFNEMLAAYFAQMAAGGQPQTPPNSLAEAVGLRRPMDMNSLGEALMHHGLMGPRDDDDKPDTPFT